jgi:hypothetical protein
MIELQPIDDPPPTAIDPLGYECQPLIPESPLDRFFPDRICDLYAPMAMIWLGMAIELYTLIRGVSAPASKAAGLGQFGYNAAINFVALLLALIAAARIHNIILGPQPAVVLKLCATVTLALAINSLIRLSTHGSLAEFPPLEIFFYVGMFWYLFDFEPWEINYCIVAMLVAKVVVVFFQY